MEDHPSIVGCDFVVTVDPGSDPYRPVDSPRGSRCQRVVRAPDRRPGPRFEWRPLDLEVGC